MTPDQLKAQELYLNSVSYETDYKPMSLPKLCDVLQNKGLNKWTIESHINCT